MSFCHWCELDLTLKSLYLSECESCLLEVGTEKMPRNLILKPALGFFLKFKIYPKKGMGEGGKQEILNFPFIPVSGF